MAREPAYRFDVEGEDLVFRVRRDAVDQEQVSRFFDYLELESIRHRSRLSEEDARAVAGDIDRSVWQHLRGQFT